MRRYKALICILTLALFMSNVQQTSYGIGIDIVRTPYTTTSETSTTTTSPTTGMISGTTGTIGTISGSTTTATLGTPSITSPSGTVTGSSASIRWSSVTGADYYKLAVLDTTTNIKIENNVIVTGLMHFVP